MGVDGCGFQRVCVCVMVVWVLTLNSMRTMSLDICINKVSNSKSGSAPRCEAWGMVASILLFYV